MIKIDNKIKKIVEKNACALATVNKDGSPHCIAVADVKLVDNKILIGDNYMAETRNNIKRNNRVALTAWNKEWKKDCVGYEILGTVDYFTDGKWLDKIKIIHKGFPAKGAILVTINKIKKLA